MLSEADIAREVGLTPAKLRLLDELQGKREAAERMRRTVALYRTAVENLPRMARRLAADESEREAAVLFAIELGLVDADAKVSEALQAVRDLASAADLPKPAERKAKPKRAGGGRGRTLSDTSRAVLALIGERGAASHTEVAEGLGLEKRGAHAVCCNLANNGHLARLDDGRYALPEVSG